MQSCNPGRGGDRFISLILLRFTEFPHGPFFAIFKVGKTQRTWENGRREMKIRSAGRMPTDRVCRPCLRPCVPRLRRRHRLGRRTADPGDPGHRRQRLDDGDLPGRDPSDRDPVPYADNPTVQRIEDRIAKAIARLAAKETPAEETVADSIPRIGLAGTPREDSGRPQTTLSSLPPLPGEITIRNVQELPQGVARIPEGEAGPGRGRRGSGAAARDGRHLAARSQLTPHCQRYFFRRNRSVFTDTTRSRKRTPSRWSISCWIATASNPIDSMIFRSPSRPMASTSTHWARWTLAV